ncbi:MAG TPA: chorismate synthase [Phycisphaerales bacterium]|nr:chorismate synthase [Phycisphaerales bacterium]
MPHLDCHTAGESHGPTMVVTITGMPAGVFVAEAFINAELKRRQGGFGRGGRQGIEDDKVNILTGVRASRTTGAPVTFAIANKDSRLEDSKRTPPVFRPRPGHADLAGAVKYLTTDCRDVLERASARETACRVAAGALARCLLREFEIEAFGCVRSIGGVEGSFEVAPGTWRELIAHRDSSETYCPDPTASEKQKAVIREAKLAKDAVGGLVEAHVFGCPPGLGSCMDWRDRLDARIAGAVMGVQAIKSVEIGLGRDAAARPGSRVHDPIRYDTARRDKEPSLGFLRDTNNAGGIEGGMTNGQPIVVRAAMKPISTLLQGLPSVDLNTKAPERSQYERSDICAVPAASVVVENAVAFEVARAFCDKFSGDSLVEVRAQYQAFLKLARQLPLEGEGTKLA